MPRLIFLLWALACSPAGAQILSLAWDNDVFFRTDANYTNGVRLSWLSDETELDCSDCRTTQVAQHLSFLPGLGSSDARYSFGASLEQLMLTPSDLSAPGPIFNDLPYAGILRTEFGLYARRPHSITAYSLLLGSTGPDSGAEQMQKLIHKLTLSKPPQGWGNQLPGELLYGINIIHGRILVDAGNGFQRQLGVGLGTHADHASINSKAGAFFRFGQQLQENILPDYTGIGTSASLPGLRHRPLFGWEGFAGITVERSFWSYISSEGRKAGYQVEFEPWIGSAIAGVSFYKGNFMTALSMKQTTSYTRQTERFFNFGSLSLIWLL